MSYDNKTGLFGFLAGAAVGATLGLLFAPRSGRETRDRIADQWGETREDVDDFINKARSEWSKAKGKASDAATMTKDEVSDFVRFLFAEGWDLKDRLRDDVTDSADEVADRARKAADRVRHSSN